MIAVWSFIVSFWILVTLSIVHDYFHLYANRSDLVSWLIAILMLAVITLSIIGYVEERKRK